MYILKKIPLITQTLSFNAVLGGTDYALRMKDVGLNMGIPRKITQAEFDKMATQLGSISFNGNSDSPIDFMPKAEDFVDIPYRFISKTVVGAGTWKATDFSIDDVLKKARNKLDMKSMFTDHAQYVGNEIGLVANPYWEEETGSGKSFVAAGISGDARIDAVSNPKLVRSLLMGALYSASVTARFTFEPSHSFDDMYSFYNELGTISAKDKKMVRRLVQEIHDFDEASIVWLGADPFAKAKNPDGTLKNIDHSSVHFSKAPDSEKTDYEERKIFSLYVGIDENIISLSKEKIKAQKSLSSDNKKISSKMNKFLIAFINAFGKDLGLTFTAPKEGEELSLSDAQVQELSDALAKLGMKQAANPEMESAASYVKTLLVPDVAKPGEFVSLGKEFITPEAKDMVVLPKAEVLKMQQELAKVPSEEQVQLTSAKVAIADSFVASQRSEALRLYRLGLNGKTEDPAYINLLNSYSYDQLKPIITQLGGTVQGMFSPFCKKCNSRDSIEMRSSVPTGTPENDTSVPNSGRSVAEIAQEKRGSGLFI